MATSVFTPNTIELNSFFGKGEDDPFAEPFAEEFRNHTPWNKDLNNFTASWQNQSLLQNTCHPQAMELSPPQSAGLEYSYDTKVDSSCLPFPESLHISNVELGPTLPFNPNINIHPSLQTLDFPPTPRTQTYTSPYSNPSPTVSDLPPPLKPRRRGPKPKSQNSKSKEEKDEIHRRFLERNKQAAKRCRERKKINIESTQTRLKHSQMDINDLTRQRDLLLLDLQNLKKTLELCTCGRLCESMSSVTATPENDREELDCESWLSTEKSEVDDFPMNLEPRHETGDA